MQIYASTLLTHLYMKTPNSLAALSLALATNCATIQTPPPQDVSDCEEHLEIADKLTRRARIVTVLAATDECGVMCPPAQNYTRLAERRLALARACTSNESLNPKRNHGRVYRMELDIERQYAQIHDVRTRIRNACLDQRKR